MAPAHALKSLVRRAVRRAGYDLVRHGEPEPPSAPGVVPEPPPPPRPPPPPPSPEGERSISIGGTTYRIASDDIYLRDLGEEFEPGTVRLFDSLTSPDHDVLDVGANIGCTAILFGVRSRSVVAFEPSPTTFAFLELNIERSGLTNVAVRNHGLGAQAGESELAFAPDNRSGAFVTDQTGGASGLVRERIVIRRLDDILPSLDLTRVHLLKLDVEGFEKSVLQGAVRTIAASRPAVVLELNHWCLNALQRTSVPDFLDYLRSIFPILLAVEGDRYADLHHNDESYTVMYRHILHSEFAMIVAAFTPDQLARFHGSYRPLHG